MKEKEKEMKEKEKEMKEKEKEMKEKEKEMKEKEKEMQKVVKEKKKELKKLRKENEVMNEKLISVINERDELISERDELMSAIEKANEETPERKNLLQQLNDISALKSNESSMIGQPLISFTPSNLAPSNQAPNEAKIETIKCEVKDQSMNTSISGTVINEPKLINTSEKGTITMVPRTKDANTSAIQVNVVSIRTSTSTLEPIVTFTDGICSPIPQQSDLNADSKVASEQKQASDEESGTKTIVKDLKKIERQLKETQALLSMKERQNQDLQRKLEDAQRQLMTAKKSSSLAIPKMLEAFSSQVTNGTKSSESSSQATSKTPAQGRYQSSSGQSTSQAIEKGSIGNEETELLQIGRSKRKMDSVPNPKSYLDQVKKVIS